MADLNSVARQPRRNRSLVHQLVSSLQTSPERISEPNHTQIENEEAVELLEPTELRRSPLHPKRLLAAAPDGIPPSKSWTLRRCTRERAIKSVTRWLESISRPELGSSQEQRSRSDSIQNHSAPNSFSNIHIPRKYTNPASVEGGIRDTEKLFQAPTSPLTQSSWNGGDHDTHCDDYSCSQSATPEDASIASTMSSVESELRVSIPVPDILYGYNLLGAFTSGERAQINSMESSVFGNNDDLLFPFLAIEQTGDGPVSRGSLWVATNQCLGASASTAMNGSEARLYVTWKHDEIRPEYSRLGHERTPHGDPDLIGPPPPGEQEDDFKAGYGPIVAFGGTRWRTGS
ncbi:hypothetical protein V502_09315 [Pseudogymnoascus sp. VKM F-4520 (FW-2644)]|nr:hypothetical protein V502_09315 [Pseudogymnoascus sp. VKM F-4520 (FW-2644)]